MKPYARTGASYGVDAPLFNISTVSRQPRRNDYGLRPLTDARWSFQPFPIGYLPVNLPDRCQQYVGKEVDQMWAFECEWESAFLPV